MVLAWQKEATAAYVRASWYARSAGHRIAVHSGGRRCGDTGGVDEDGGDGPAVHRAAVDGPQENQGGGGVPGVGQRDENSVPMVAVKPGSAPTIIPTTVPVRMTSRFEGEGMENKLECLARFRLLHQQRPGSGCPGT